MSNRFLLAWSASVALAIGGLIVAASGYPVVGGSLLGLAVVGTVITGSAWRWRS